jgi:hypothetical protein
LPDVRKAVNDAVSGLVQVTSGVQRMFNGRDVPFSQLAERMAGTTGLEPATFAVTGVQPIRGFDAGVKQFLYLLRAIFP